MSERVSTLEVRQRLGDMLNRVALRHDEFVIERKGKPLAALVPVERLEQMRQIGAVLSEHGFFASAEDIFYLNTHEVHEALSDLGLAWSGGAAARGTVYWPPRVARRKEILARLAEWTPPPALGPIPHALNDPALTPVVLKARKFVKEGQHFGGDVYEGGMGYDKSTGREYTDLSDSRLTLSKVRIYSKVTQELLETTPFVIVNMDKVDFIYAREEEADDAPA